MRLEIGELNVEIVNSVDFRKVITYIDSDYSRKCKEVGVNYTPEHVFDEDKSVKWNREQIAIRNDEKNKLRDIIRLEKITRYKELYRYMKTYIAEFLELPELSDEAFDAIHSFLQSAYDHDWPNELDSLIVLLYTFKKELSKS